MDIPQEIMNAVKVVTPPTVAKSNKAGVKHNVQKRVIKAINNGLRSTESISSALHITPKQVSAALNKLLHKKAVWYTKREGSSIRRWYVAGTAEPTQVQAPTEQASEAKEKHTRDMMNGKLIRELKATIAELELQNKALREQGNSAINAKIQDALREKEKELWNLESELFDKKAIITYLEEKIVRLQKAFGSIDL